MGRQQVERGRRRGGERKWEERGTGENGKGNVGGGGGGDLRSLFFLYLFISSTNINNTRKPCINHSDDAA